MAGRGITIQTPELKRFPLPCRQVKSGGRVLSRGSRSELVRLACCVCAKSWRDSLGRSGKRPLPPTSCENSGEPLEHPEAVYSSAKWTQKHLLWSFTGRGQSDVRKLGAVECPQTVCARQMRARRRRPRQLRVPRSHVGDTSSFRGRATHPGLQREALEAHVRSAGRGCTFSP